MLLNKLLYCTVKNGWTQPYGLSLCLIPTSEPVQTVICISKIQKTKGIVQRNSHRWTTYSESCLLIFFGVCTQKCPASTLRCSRKFAIHFRLCIKCFFYQSPNVERADYVCGIQLIPNSPQLDNAPLVYFTDTEIASRRHATKVETLFSDVMNKFVPKYKGIFSADFIQKWAVWKECKLQRWNTISESARSERMVLHSHVHSDNPISIIFWITTTLRIVCGWNWASLFQLRRHGSFSKAPKKGCASPYYCRWRTICFNQTCFEPGLYLQVCVPKQTFGWRSRAN